MRVFRLDHVGEDNEDLSVQNHVLQYVVFVLVSYLWAGASYAQIVAPIDLDIAAESSIGSATLSWQAPTLNENGTALTNLAGYKIYFGEASGNYPNTIEIDNPSVTTYVVDGLAAGTYYFVATAYNTDGVESAFSGEAVKVVQAVSGYVTIAVEAWTPGMSDNVISMGNVGTVPLGTPCERFVYISTEPGGHLNQVLKSEVEFFPGAGGFIIYAQCAEQ